MSSSCCSSGLPDAEHQGPTWPSRSQGADAPGAEKHKNVTYGVAHIKNSFNNTIVTISDQEGNVLSWASAG